MRRLLDDIGKSRWSILAALAALFVVRWAVLRTRPERLGPFPSATGRGWLGVHGNEAILYNVDDDTGEMTVTGVPVFGGKTRTIFRDTQDGADGAAQLDGDDIYIQRTWYGTVLSPAPPDRTRVAAGGISKRRPSAGPPTASPPASVRSDPYPWRRNAPVRTTLCRIPIAGGTPVSIELDPLHRDIVFENAVAVGRTIFWVKRRPLASPNNNSMKPGGSVSRPLWRYALMATPAAGSARQIATGVYAGSRLYAADSGVVWRAWTGAASQPADIVFARADGAVALQHDSSVVFGQAPVRSGDRLFWINEEYASRRDGWSFPEMTRREIMSANLDGSDPRVLLTLMQNGEVKVALTRLFSWRGALYGLVADGQRISDDQTARHFVCRIHPDSETPFERIVELPRRTGFRTFLQNDDLYFLVMEENGGWLSWADIAPAPEGRWVLYRVRMSEER